MNDLKTEILDAACRAVVRDGLRELSVERVAADSGVKPDEVHSHFPTLNALITAAFDHADSRATTLVMKGVPEMTAGQRLAYLLTAYLTDDEDIRADWIFWIEMEAAALFDVEIKGVVSDRISNWRMTVSSLISVSQTEGSIPAEVDPEASGDRLVLIQDAIGRLRAMGIMGEKRALKEMNEAIARELAIQVPTGDHPA